MCCPGASTVSAITGCSPAPRARPASPASASCSACPSRSCRRRQRVTLAQIRGAAAPAAAAIWSSSRSWRAAFNPEHRHQLQDQPGDGYRDPARPAPTQRPGSSATDHTAPHAHAAADLVRDAKLHSLGHKSPRIVPRFTQGTWNIRGKSKHRNRHTVPVRHHHVSLESQIPIAKASGPRVRSSGTFVRQEAPETLHGTGTAGFS